MSGPSRKWQQFRWLLRVARAVRKRKVRIPTLQKRTETPDTDYQLSREEIFTRLGKSTNRVRDKVEHMASPIRVGEERGFSARGLEQWIAEQRAARMASALPTTRMLSSRCCGAWVW